METQSDAWRARLLRGTRLWHVFALPMTLILAMLLISIGNSEALAPATGALIDASPQTPLVSSQSADQITLLYSDSGRGEQSTLRLPATDFPPSAW